MNSFGNVELETAIQRALGHYLSAMNNRKFYHARLAAASAASWCESALQQIETTASAAEKSWLLITGVFCAACRDFTDCCELGSKEQLDHEEIETLWVRFVDCVDRLNYIDGAFEGPIKEWLTVQASRLEDRLEQQLGPGLYSSPEIVFDRVLCNICKDDFRRCAHRAGHIYDGTICKQVSQGGYIRAIAIVTDPVDRRCRHWPWNVNEADRTSTATILCVFDATDLRDPREKASEPPSLPMPPPSSPLVGEGVQGAAGPEAVDVVNGSTGAPF